MTKSPPFPPKVRTVEIVAFHDVQLLDVAGPLQVFASANQWALDNDASAPYALAVVAARTPVLSSAGMALVVNPLPRPARPLDTLIVAGGRGVHAAAADRRFVRWLGARAKNAARVVSVCTGAFLLGETGLLDGRRVVTHWQECDRLAKRFPGAGIAEDAIYVHDGRIWTSAGVTAGIDLALALVESDLGHRAALAIARDLVVFLRRPGGQSQFSEALALQTRSSDFEDLHAWMAGHLSHDLTVRAIAERAGMSERSFIRHYVNATGVTPARAVEKMRVEAARRMLETTSWPTKRIAARCGFGTEETMRRSFQRQIAVAPGEYRARFAVTATSLHRN